MELYHGSYLEIESIDISMCKPYKDFGRGFYLTAMFDQAAQMAVRSVRFNRGEPYVSMFEFDESARSDASLSIKHFETPTIKWAEFVLNNRNRKFKQISSPNCNHDNKYDIVIGAVANDDIALQLMLFINNMVNPAVIADNLTYKDLTNQYSFHTSKALKYLTKVSARKV